MSRAIGEPVPKSTCKNSQWLYELRGGASFFIASIASHLAFAKIKDLISFDVASFRVLCY